MMNRRVVVTGLGLISPLGNDLASSWAAALEGKSGIARITGFDASEFGCQIAGEVKGFDAGKYLDVKEVRRFDKFVHFGVGARGFGTGSHRRKCADDWRCNRRRHRRPALYLRQ